MYGLTLLALAPAALGQLYMFSLDCSQYPGPCNNDCYAAYSANKGTTLNYAGPGTGGDGRTSSQRRYAAGCTSPSPCGPSIPMANSDETSCDEYPYASTIEGGQDAILRCTDYTENVDEGRALGAFTTSVCGSQACTFQITFTNTDGNTPYCVDMGGANDGFEYRYVQNGVYVQNRRDVAADNGSWVLHEPKAEDYHPPHLRREFLLADGSRTMLSSRDQDATYEDAIFYTLVNGTAVKTPAVKELKGLEKSYALQHPALRQASKRAVEFQS